MCIESENSAFCPQCGKQIKKSNQEEKELIEKILSEYNEILPEMIKNYVSFKIKNILFYLRKINLNY